VGGRKVRPGRGLHAAYRRLLKLPNTHQLDGRSTRYRERANVVEFVRTFTYVLLYADTLDQPGTLNVAKLWNKARRRVRRPFFRAAMLAQELLLYSTQIPGSQGSPSQIQVEVTGIHFDLVSMTSR
jgi:hypothetical protein